MSLPPGTNRRLVPEIRGVARLNRIRAQAKAAERHQRRHELVETAAHMRELRPAAKAVHAEDSRMLLTLWHCFTHCDEGVSITFLPREGHNMVALMDRCHRACQAGAAGTSLLTPSGVAMPRFSDILHYCSERHARATTDFSRLGVTDKAFMQRYVGYYDVVVVEKGRHFDKEHLPYALQRKLRLETTLQEQLEAGLIGVKGRRSRPRFFPEPDGRPAINDERGAVNRGKVVQTSNTAEKLKSGETLVIPNATISLASRVPTRYHSAKSNRMHSNASGDSTPDPVQHDFVGEQNLAGSPTVMEKQKSVLRALMQAVGPNQRTIAIRNPEDPEMMSSFGQAIKSPSSPGTPRSPRTPGSPRSPRFAEPVEQLPALTVLPSEEAAMLMLEGVTSREEQHRILRERLRPHSRSEGVAPSRPVSQSRTHRAINAQSSGVMSPSRDAHAARITRSATKRSAGDENDAECLRSRRAGILNDTANIDPPAFLDASAVSTTSALFASPFDPKTDGFGGLGDEPFSPTMTRNIDEGSILDTSLVPHDMTAKPSRSSEAVARPRSVSFASADAANLAHSRMMSGSVASQDSRSESPTLLGQRRQLRRSSIASPLKRRSSSLVSTNNGPHRAQIPFPLGIVRNRLGEPVKIDGGSLQRGGIALSIETGDLFSLEWVNHELGVAHCRRVIRATDPLLSHVVTVDDSVAEQGTYFVLDNDRSLHTSEQTGDTPEVSPRRKMPIPRVVVPSSMSFLTDDCLEVSSTTLRCTSTFSFMLWIDIAQVSRLSEVIERRTSGSPSPTMPREGEDELSAFMASGEAPSPRGGSGNGNDSDGSDQEADTAKALESSPDNRRRLLRVMRRSSSVHMKGGLSAMSRLKAGQSDVMEDTTQHHQRHARRSVLDLSVMVGKKRLEGGHTAPIESKIPPLVEPCFAHESSLAGELNNGPDRQQSGHAVSADDPQCICCHKALSRARKRTTRASPQRPPTGPNDPALSRSNAASGSSNSLLPMTEPDADVAEARRCIIIC